MAYVHNYRVDNSISSQEIIQICKSEDEQQLQEILAKWGDRCLKWIYQSGNTWSLLYAQKHSSSFNWSEALKYAAFGRSLDVIKLCIKNGATLCHNTLLPLCSSGFYDAVEYLLPFCKRRHLYRTLTSAASGGHIRLLYLLARHGANDWVDAFEMAAERRENVETFEFLMCYCIKHKYISFRDAILRIHSRLQVLQILNNVTLCEELGRLFSRSWLAKLLTDISFDRLYKVFMRSRNARQEKQMRVFNVSHTMMCKDLCGFVARFINFKYVCTLKH